MYSPKRRFRLFRAFGPPTPPTGSGNDVLSFARTLSTTYLTSDATPTDGGALTLNSESVGNYEVTARKSNTTISSFTASDWFTNTKDTTSSWIIINGDLTINSGQTLIPPVRKLFTVVYVTGNLVVNGAISMSARGANHSGTGDSGGATTAVAIRIGTGTFSAVSNPQIPATGGAGGVAKTYAFGTTNYNSGTAGTNGGSGGGGTGEAFGSGGVASAGAAGTCFSGGAGSGGAYSATSGAGGANGGAGGAGGGSITGGGTGNPGGAKGSGGVDGNSGTGGTLIVIVAGSLSGSGTITAHGVGGARPTGSPGGGGSGGGSVTVLYGSNPSSAVTVTATGGAGLASGNGGNGTARKLAIGAN